MRNADGHVRQTAVVKLGPSSDIGKEVSAYNKEVKRLPIGLYAPLTEMIQMGNFGRGAAFYSLAQEFQWSLFELVAKDDAAAAETIRRLRDRMKIWLDEKRVINATVSDLRKTILWDETYAQIITEHELDFSQVESRAVRYEEACIHGDMHGGNVLVDSEGKALLIDYGDVRRGCASLDPVALELSLLFHPFAIELGLSKAVLDAIDYRDDPDAYISRHPFPKFAGACLEWAYDVSGGDHAVRATEYAYVLRQLKFGGIQVDRHKKLLTAIASKLA
jgi:hypothetical protein